MTSVRPFAAREQPARRTVEPEGSKSVAPSSAGPIVVLPKLTVGASDDPLEREADRVAADVVATLRRTVDVGSRAGLDDALAATGSRIRRTTARPVESGPTTAYAAVPRIRRRPDAPGIGGAGGDLDADTESRIRRASGGGRPLDPSTLSTMGPAFGADFSAVRVHANDEAGQLNRQINARAFTSGNDIFFGAGQYQPSSDDGQRLLAHELTHVVQRQTPAIRRHDAHNNKRLASERTKNTGPGKQFATKAAADNKRSGMRMDHTVADSKLTDLADDLQKVDGFVSKAGDRYSAAAAAWKAVDTALKALPVDDEGQGLGGRLANLRMNLVPGLIDASDNVGDEFDPIMETVGSVVQTTVESDAFLELDNAARALARLTPHLPAVSTKMKGNTELDQALATSLTTIARTLGTGAGTAEPTFDPTVWDETANGKHVKKPAGDRFTAPPPALQSLPVANIPAHPVRRMEWTIDVVVHAKGAPSRTVTVTVNAKITSQAWQHIYERHTLEYFRGRVRPIDTFWKLDPQAVITQQLLEPEITLQIDRRFELAASLANQLDDNDVDLTGTADQVFVQGQASFRATAPVPRVVFKLESVAPQHHDLGWSIAPKDLAAWSVPR